ncbi:calcium ATPase, partial [Conidiobolus coronatus NRRL 28638]
TQMDSYNQLQVIPFNSKNKWMLSLYRPKNTSNPFQTSKRVLMMKGAPDVLIPHCKYILTDDGREVPFDEAAKNFISDEQIRWSSQGQRVLMLTRAILDDDVNFVEPTNEIGISSIVPNLTIIGLLGIIDPPRDQIPETIVKFKSAGIRIFMVTGDFALTAAAIARQIGILTSDDNDDLDRLRHRPDPQFDIRVHGELKSSPDTVRSLVLTGTDINALTDEDWSKVCGYDEIVFARTTPEQKLKIVQEFQARDNIVGVTGDGVNDSPALKCANIGIAMGGGSEVAMEAAHMVLLDNNFTSIVTAIESGRLVFDNLKKVILYLLPAGSFSEMVPILINAILGVPLPLSPFLMIVICVLTDMISSLAIMCEKPESDLLLRPPRRPKQDRLVNFKLLLHAYGFIGIQETLYAHIAYFTYMKQAGGLKPSDLLLVFDKWTDGYLGHTQAELDHLNFTGQTIFFVTLVIMQCCGNLFSTRTRKVSTFTQNPAFGPTRNPYVILSIIGSICISLIVVYVPFFNNVFKTRPIPLGNWFIPIGFAMLILIVEEFRKFMIRRYPRSILAKLAW